jgi:hypothetical protein
MTETVTCTVAVPVTNAQRPGTLRQLKENLLRYVRVDVLPETVVVVNGL